MLKTAFTSKGSGIVVHFFLVSQHIHILELLLEKKSRPNNRRRKTKFCQQRQHPWFSLFLLNFFALRLLLTRLLMDWSHRDLVGQCSFLTLKLSKARYHSLPTLPQNNIQNSNFIFHQKQQFDFLHRNFIRPLSICKIMQQFCPSFSSFH